MILVILIGVAIILAITWTGDTATQARQQAEVKTSAMRPSCVPYAQFALLKPHLQHQRPMRRPPYQQLTQQQQHHPIYHPDTACGQSPTFMVHAAIPGYQTRQYWLLAQTSKLRYQQILALDFYCPDRQTLSSLIEPSQISLACVT